MKKSECVYDLFDKLTFRDLGWIKANYAHKLNINEDIYLICTTDAFLSLLNLKLRQSGTIKNCPVFTINSWRLNISSGSAYKAYTT
jgi:hypothetical protein